METKPLSYNQWLAKVKDKINKYNTKGYTYSALDEVLMDDLGTEQCYQADVVLITDEAQLKSVYQDYLEMFS